MEIVYLLFSLFELYFLLRILGFKLLLLVDEFRETVVLVSDVFEESIEVLFQKLVLITSDVAPLDHHIVKSNVDIVEHAQWLNFGQFVQGLPGLLMQICKQISNFIESVDFLCDDVLQFFPSSGDLLEFLLYFGHFGLHFRQIHFVLLRQPCLHFAIETDMLGDTCHFFHFI